MESYWIFNVTPRHSELRILESSDIRQRAEIVLEDREEKLPSKEGDYLLTLNKNGQYYFDHKGVIKGEIKNIEIPLSRDELEFFYKKNTDTTEVPPRKYRHIVPVQLEPINRNLNDFTYSLISVESYSRPYNHFKRKYTRFNEYDYDTIVKNYLYVSRTVFGRLFNSLPKDNQYDVILQMMGEWNLKLRDAGYFKASNFLRNYIEENIIEIGRYLVKIDQLIENDFSRYGMNRSVIAFKSSDDNSEDFVRAQAECFQELFSLNFDLSLIDDLAKQIKDNGEIEKRFEEEFKSRRWPINMSI